MPFLPIGAYDVTVSMKGFATTVAKGTEATLNKTATLNLPRADVHQRVSLFGLTWLPGCRAPVPAVATQ